MHRHGAAAVGHHGIGPCHLVEIGGITAQHHVVVGMEGRADAEPPRLGDHPLQSHPIRQPQRHHVFRFREPRRQAGAAIAVAGTVAAACYATQRRAAEPLTGFDVLAECCQEGEQLEGGAGLTQGLDSVEAALAVVAAAHIGKDRAVAHIEADQGGLVEAHRAGLLLQESAHLPLRQLLEARIHRADHRVVAAAPLRVEVEAEAATLEFAAHIVAEIGVALAAGFAAGGGIDVQGPAQGVAQAVLVDEALLIHAPQHQVAALQGRPAVHRGIGRQWGEAGAVAIGAGQQTHQEGGFGQVELAGRFAEIELGRLLEALGAQAQGGAVEVHLQDAALAVAGLQLPGHPEFAQLAAQAHIVAHGRVIEAGYLLGEAAAAARALHQGAHGAEQIKAAVPAEAGILRGNQGQA